MKTELKILSGAVLLALSAGANADVVVDLFSTPQGAYSDNTKDPTDTGTIINSGVGGSVGVGDATILGGNRDIFISKIENYGSDGAGGLTPVANDTNLEATAVVSGGLFNFSTDSLTSGRAQIQWDGIEGTNAIAHTGLGGLDLIASGGDAFVTNVVFSDAGFDIAISAYTSAANWTKVTLTSIAHPVPGVSEIPFSAFGLTPGCYDVAANPVACGTPGSVRVEQFGTGGSFSNLGALVVDIDQFGKFTSLDLSIDSINIPTVPEPSVLGLMGVGLFAAGFSTFKSRRRNSSLAA